MHVQLSFGTEEQKGELHSILTMINVMNVGFKAELPSNLFFFFLYFHRIITNLNFYILTRNIELM